MGSWLCTLGGCTVVYKAKEWWGLVLLGAPYLRFIVNLIDSLSWEITSVGLWRKTC